MKRFRKKTTQLTAWQFLALGFLVVITIGALLLCLPFATRKGESTTALNAFFTSTSATCVTGLVSYDTNTHWSIFGQVVIICLIQLGGLGFMAFVSLLLGLVGKNKRLSHRKVLMIATGENNRSEIWRLFKRLLIGTLIFEGLGAALLSIRFIGQFGTLKGIYYAVWHSISAFCNAGFDLMGGTLGDGKFISFTHYATDPLVSLTLIFLIILGGLGFCVWDDFIECRGKIKKFALHTKIVLAFTLVLLFFSTMLFLLFEWQNPDYQGYSFGEKLLVSFFNATTPRTAGFNTVDFSHLTDSSYLLTVMLMFVGGSSASTAGGVKITTLFVIIMGMLSVFRGKRDIDVGKRRIDNDLLKQALAVFVSCLFIILTATLCICTFERQNDTATFQAVLFETVSAMGTVGLSFGLTPSLCAASKIVLMLVMYAGRVGILTIGLAFGEQKSAAEVKKPLGNILIG